MNEIERFIENLSSVSLNNVSNLYINDNDGNIRKHNLTMYLTTMKKINPDILFLGEAPGYKGCGFTGIPFTSEKILYENNFFRNQEYKYIHKIDNLESEISATIVWNELENLPFQPLIWNIFPFHPYKSDNKNSNRTPNLDELDEGVQYLKQLLEIFKINKIISIGRKPEQQLLKNGFTYKYIRHPANGGKHKFVTGLKTEFQNVIS